MIREACGQKLLGGDEQARMVNALQASVQTATLLSAEAYSRTKQHTRQHGCQANRS